MKFRRKLESSIQTWLADEREERPLLVKGVRRCGKTFLVEHMDSLSGRAVIKLDFQTDSLREKGASLHSEYIPNILFDKVDATTTIYDESISDSAPVSDLTKSVL